MTGDPDDKSWLDPEKVAVGWNKWQNRFVKHYGLSDSQAGSLNRLINGNAYFAAPMKLENYEESIWLRQSSKESRLKRTLCGLMRRRKNSESAEGCI